MLTKFVATARRLRRSRDMFEAMNRAITQHGIRPVIDRDFGFDEVPAAFRHMQGTSHLGKIVIQAP